MAYAAKILADSISTAGHRLTTFLVTFPRIVLAEVNTHKMLSKSSASSRAVPVEKRIAAVEADPFVPAQFGKNKKGMQHDETLDDDASRNASSTWYAAKSDACAYAGHLARLEVHKQLANRLLEPFSWHTAVISGTDWSNFWNLRVSAEAQGEFREAAAMMKALYDERAELRAVGEGDWHLPFVEGSESFEFEVGGAPPTEIAKISAARCARVSYNTHDGRRDRGEDLKLYERLIEPGHMAPLEHPARPMTEWERDAFEQFEADFWVEGDGTRTMRVNRDFLERVQGYDPKTAKIRLKSEPKRVHYCGNYNGWTQLRKLVPGEADIRGYRGAALR